MVKSDNALPESNTRRRITRATRGFSDIQIAIEYNSICPCNRRTSGSAGKKTVWQVVRQISSRVNALPPLKPAQCHIFYAGRAMLSPAADLVCSKWIVSIPDRSCHQASRSVEFIDTKLFATWRSLTSVYLRSFHSFVPSNFGGSLEPTWV